MFLTDGVKTVRIRMYRSDGMNLSPDFSLDFFSAGGLDYNDNTGVYRVQDVDYCVEQAMDCKYGRGDFSDPDVDPEAIQVFVDDTSVLRVLREQRNWSRDRLSKESGVNPRQIQRIENGESSIRNVTFGNVLKLADALGVDPRDFIF